MKKLIFSLCLVFSISLNAQTEFGDTFKSRLFFGGNFGLNLGTITLIEVSPLAGFNLTERLSAGVGMTYIYYSDNRYIPPIRQNIFGARVFSRFLVFDQLFVHAEFEGMNLSVLGFNPANGLFESYRTWQSAIPIGLGYRSQVGANSYFTMMLLYDAKYDRMDPNSFYPGGLLYRIGFIFGLY